MELAIVKFFNRFELGFIDRVTEFISKTSFLVVLWTVVTFYFLFTDKIYGPEIMMGVIVALALHFAIDEGIIKHGLAKLFFRKRPYVAHSEITPIGKRFTSSSFPSSHMATTLAPLTVYFAFHPEFWPVMVIFILLMAFARLRSGMHYPSDVLAGAVLGIVYGTAALLVVRW